MIPRIGQIYPAAGMMPGRSRTATLDIHDNAGNSPLAVPDSMTPPSNAQSSRPEPAHPQYSPAQFGDGQLSTVVFAGAGNLLVIARPPQFQRVLLIIVNDIAGFNVRVNFDSAANVTTGFPIPPGGNIFFDNVVPQNDIHVFSPVAGNIQVAFMNIDITNAQRLT